MKKEVEIAEKVANMMFSDSYFEDKHSDEEIIGFLKSLKNINMTDKDGRTFLMHAACYNRLGTLNYLIKRGVDINAQDTVGYTALHFAAQNCLLKVTQILLNNHASIDIKDVYGDTPLWRAVMNYKDDDSVIAILLKCGANKNTKNNYDSSPMDIVNESIEELKPLFE